ncbi:MAG: folate family ECF transporter S component [Acutalibacteraceae bacterium]
MSKKKNAKTPTEVLVNLVCCALLIALQVVLSRFLSFQTWNLKIGFSFVPVVLAARLFGPVASMLVYGIGDVIGTFLFPVGAYFPGFTVSAVLSGLIYGLFLYKKSGSYVFFGKKDGQESKWSEILRIAGAVGLIQLICSFLLNSLWISIAYGAPFAAQLATRWPQSLGMGVVQIVLLALVLERLCDPVEKILKKGSRRAVSVKTEE